MRRGGSSGGLVFRRAHAGAAKFLDDAQNTLKEAATTNDRPPEVAKIQISLLLAASDVKDALGDASGALSMAATAEVLSNNFVKNYPADPTFKHLLYASKFRLGDQFDKHSDKENRDKALKAYSDALDIAREQAKSDTTDKSYQHDVIFALQKVGDVTLHNGPTPLEGEALIRAAADCELIVSYRQSPGSAEVFERLPKLVAFLRCERLCRTDADVVDVVFVAVLGEERRCEIRSSISSRCASY